MKPLILISNDDGVDAPGLRLLADCANSFVDVVVVAPDSARSGQSSALTFNAPLRINEHPDYHGATIRSVTGTPVDCIKIAMHTILTRKPDLMLSGINHGSNAGNSVIYSGTMGAVFEACMLDIPAIGFSLLHHSWEADFSECITPTKEIISKVINGGGLPTGVCLNVNYPAKVKIEGAKVVRAAKSHWTQEYQRYDDPSGKPFFWLTGRMINEEPDNPETDLYWLDRNYATIVPTRADQNASDKIKSITDLLAPL